MATSSNITRKNENAPHATTTTTDSSSMEDDISHVLQLMVAKSRGQVKTDEVEHAVSQLLQKTTPKTPTTPPPDNNMPIQPDLDDYDNIEESAPAPKPSSTTTSTCPFPQATLEDMLQQDNTKNPLDCIPLGRVGAKMMVTFGDGPSPKPAAVSAALLGARKCLQASIQDARALRRSQKHEYLQARNIAMLSSKDGKLKGNSQYHGTEQSPNPTMLYRAMQGWDKLAYDPKCGFDVEQLRTLFPEEMQAYSRWKEMHNEYKEKTSDDNDAETNTNNTETTSEETSLTNTKPSHTDVPVADGHLEERAAQFDVRTDQMQQDWYLKFSEVRRGSFLPKKSGQKKACEKEWNDKRKKPRGRPKAGNWDTMTATSVRFLHWVGFDPRSALPPPNDEVTEALAFLAYDFMGRIVEKAIYLKNVAHQKEDANQVLLLELRDGQQLDASDIERAIHDSTIQPVPLYSSLDKPVAAQLYFGPGFEDRLEMEMEELASKRKRLTPKELEIRQAEDELFQTLQQALPKLDGFQNVLHEDMVANEDNSISESAVPISNQKNKKQKKKK